MYFDFIEHLYIFSDYFRVSKNVKMKFTYIHNCPTLSPIEKKVLKNRKILE